MTRERAVAAAPPTSDRLAREAERVLRALGDARLGIGLLIVAGAIHALAAALPNGPSLLDAWPYAVLLGVIVLGGVASVAVRAPAAWREWRRPGSLPATSDVLVADLELARPLDAAAREQLVDRLRRAGYVVRESGSGARWAVHGTRRGWSRFAAIASHLALVLLLVGAAVGAAFGRETTFTLLPGEQALLDEPRAGFADAVRLERLDAAFGARGRPLRLDTEVTFLRDGQAAARETLQVNRPGDFGGYIVHPWTYGPAAVLRITTLGATPLLDGALPLDEVRGGRPFGLAELSPVGATVGVTLSDADANEVTVSVADAGGLLDVARLKPGMSARVGDLEIELDSLAAYVTFLSRRDPGIGLLFAGAAGLTACLTVAFWLPRRRVSLRPAGDSLRLTLRGERLDRPGDELERLRQALSEPARA